jgi:hypothetical protein
MPGTDVVSLGFAVVVSEVPPLGDVVVPVGVGVEVGVELPVGPLVVGPLVGPLPPPPPLGALGDSAWAGDIATACTSGTVHTAAAPTIAPRLSRSRRLVPSTVSLTSSFVKAGPRAFASYHNPSAITNGRIEPWRVLR